MSKRTSKPLVGLNKIFSTSSTSAVTVSEKLKISDTDYSLASTELDLKMYRLFIQWGASPPRLLALILSTDMAQSKVINRNFINPICRPTPYVDPVAGFGIKAKVTKDSRITIVFT